MVNGGARPDGLRLKTIGTMWFVNNATQVFDINFTPLSITSCTVNNIQVPAVFERISYVFDYNVGREGGEGIWDNQTQQRDGEGSSSTRTSSSTSTTTSSSSSSSSTSSQQQQGTSYELALTLSLDSIFWDTLLGPIQDGVGSGGKYFCL